MRRPLSQKPSVQRAAGLPARRIRIQDVASVAGVSLGTVSAVLNSNGRVSEPTRQRVRAVMEQLAYRPDLYASNLARRETKLLGVVVSNLQNAFFAETAQAIEEEAMRHGLQVSLMATNFSPRQQLAAVKHLLGARMAGLAVITSEQSEPVRKLVVASGVPAVFLDTGKPSENSTVLRVGSRLGMRCAVEHLLQLGHRDLVFVQNSVQAHGSVLLSHKLRHQGVRDALRYFRGGLARLTVVDIPGPSADAGERAVEVLLGKVKFTAMIAVTDAVALGIYRGLQRRGVAIPRQVSVVGFDNAEYSRFLSPALTTVDVSRQRLSALVVEQLLAAKRGNLLTVAATLVERDSTCAPQ